MYDKCKRKAYFALNIANIRTSKMWTLDGACC